MNEQYFYAAFSWIVRYDLLLLDPLFITMEKSNCILSFLGNDYSMHELVPTSLSTLCDDGFTLFLFGIRSASKYDIDKLHRILKQQCSSRISELVQIDEPIFDQGKILTFDSDGRHELRENVRIHLDYHSQNYRLQKRVEHRDTHNLIYSMDWLINDSVSEMLNLFEIAKRINATFAYRGIDVVNNLMYFRFFLVVEGEDQVNDFKRLVHEAGNLILENWQQLTPAQLPNLLNFNPVEQLTGTVFGSWADGVGSAAIRNREILEQLRKNNS